MGYLNEYNKKNKKEDTTTSSNGGGYLSQYESQSPAPTKTATPTKKSEPIVVKKTAPQSNGFDVGGFLSNLGDTIKNAFSSALPNQKPPDVNTLGIEDSKKKANVPLVLNDKLSGNSPQLNSQIVTGGVPNIIDTLLRPFTQAPKVISPIPGQNITPVNKSKLDLVKQAVNIGVPNTVSAIKEIFEDPLSLKADPKKIVDDVWKAVKEPLIKGARLEIQSRVNTPKTVSGQIGLQAQKISNTANILFTPITALFTAANDLPVLGSVSRIISIPFVAAGETGTGISNDIIDSLPIPKQAKERLKPGVGEIAALAMQIALGKALEGGKKEVTDAIDSTPSVKPPHIRPGETIGQYQQRIQSPDLTAYENAFKVNDTATINKLAAKHPTDARFQVHTNEGGNFTPLTVNDGSIIAKAQESATAAKPFNLLDLIPALVHRYGKTDTKTIVDAAQNLADERNKILGKETIANNNVMTAEELRNQATGTNLKDTPTGEQLLNIAAEAEKQGKNIKIDATDVKEGTLITPDGTSFKITFVEDQTVGQKLLGAPKTPSLLEEPKPSNIGDTFTMSDKVDKNKIEISKKIADYRESVQAYNKNPTVRTLQRFQRMRTVMDNLKKQDVVIEKPAKSSAIKPSEASPKIARINEAKNYTSASDFAEAVYAAKATDKIGLLDSKMIEARDAIDRSGKTYKDTIIKLKSGRAVDPIEVEYVDGKLRTVDGSNRLGAAQEAGKPIPVIFRGTDKVPGLKTLEEVFGNSKAPESAGKVDVKPKESTVHKNLQKYSNNGKNEYTFIRNTEKAPRPTIEDKFGQNIEPAGKYMNIVTSESANSTMSYYEKNGIKNFESGNIEFKNPLIIDKTGYTSKEWKQKLSDEYNGKTGKELTNAIIDKGYDGIITLDKGSPDESIKFDVKPKVISVPRENLPVGEGAPTVSRLEARMKGVMKNATPDQIEQLGLSKSNTAENEQQLSEASKYVSEKPQEALDVLEGRKEAPKGLLKNAIYVAMVEQAKLDVTLATKLVGLSAKRFGQELQILSELDPNNPVKIMNDVYNFREASYKRKNPTRDVTQAKKDVVESIKKNVKKPDRYDWESFINSIETC
jgi:hypothetical protein